MYVWADFYRSRGLSAIPLAQGKTPGVKWKEYQSRIASRRELSSWFQGQSRFWGLALVCGAVSDNLVRIDFDDPTDYEDLKSRIPSGLPAFQSQRQGGGYGVLFKSTENIPTLPQRSFQDRPKAEVRGEGSITVVPPTPGYKWLTKPSEELPAISGYALLYDLFGFDMTSRRNLADSVGQSAHDELHRLLTETEEGERNGNIVRIASMLRARGLDHDSARIVVETAFEQHWSQDSMDVDEVRETFDRAWERYEHEGVRITGTQKIGNRTLEAEAPEDAPKLKRYKPSMPDKTKKDNAFLIEGLMQAGTAAFAVMAAFAGAGKTTVCHEIAIQANRGDPVWGVYNVPKPLRIVYIDEEDREEQIRDTVMALQQIYGEVDPDTFDTLAMDGGHFAINKPWTLSILTAELERLKPDLVFLDGWQWFVGGDPNEKTLTNEAIAWLKATRIRLKFGLWVIHHTRKIGAPMFRPANPIELASGAQELMNSAPTKLIYEQLTKVVDFSVLQGTTGKFQWNPIRVVLDYDRETNSHRFVTQEDAAEMFDPDVYGSLWDYTPEKNRFRRMLSTIMNRLGLNRKDIADMLGVDKAQVTRWYAGKRTPSADNEARLADLYEKAKKQPLKARQMPKPRSLMGAAKND